MYENRGRHCYGKRQYSTSDRKVLTVSTFLSQEHGVITYNLFQRSSLEYTNV
jgi:hypothetical protein